MRPFETSSRRPAHRLLALALAAAAATCLPAHAADHVWLDGSGNHLWYSSGGFVGGVFQPNWSAAGAPSFGSPGRVFIDNNPARNSRVQIAPLSLVNTPFCTNPITCGTFAVAAEMTIDAGDTAVVGGATPFGDSVVHFNNGHVALQMMDIGGVGSTLTNNGLLRISSDGKYAKLAIQGVATLTGSGQTLLDNGYAAGDSRATFNSNQVVFGANGFGDRLVIAAGHTVRGRGSLGYNGTLAIDNFGTVQAEAGGQLILNGLVALPAPRTHGVVNGGTLRAVDGARLWVTTSVDNTGGLVEAGDSSVVDLSAGLSNGTLRTSGSGVIRSTTSGFSYPIVAGDVLLQGRLQAPDGTKLGLGRRLTNQGVLQVGGAAAVGVGSPGGVSELHFMEDTLIDGTGRIELSERATAFNRFTGYSGVIGRTPVLTLGAGQTLTGAGILGGANTSARTLDIVNQGTILVEGVNGLQLAAATSNTGFTNQGTLTVRSLLQVTGGATNRGLMVVEAGAQAFGTLNQADGTLTVDGTADAVRLSGGLLNGTGTVSSLLQSGGSFLPGHSPGSFTIDGNYTLNGGDLVLEIDGDDPAQQDHLFINGNASFRGGRVVIDLTGYQGSGAASFAGLLNVAGTLSLAHPVSGASASFVVAGLDSGRSAQLAWSGGQLSLNLGLAAAVPEPGTWATLLAGLAAIGLRLARRRVAA